MSDQSPPLDLVDLHQRALDATGAIVGRARDDQMDEGTPCDDWNVRQLLDHVIAGNWWASELAAGATIDDVGDRFDGDNVTADAFAAYEASAAAAQAAFAAPGAMDAHLSLSHIMRKSFQFSKKKKKKKKIFDCAKNTGARGNGTRRRPRET